MSARGDVCGLCGHEMTLTRCGFAAVFEVERGNVALCHHDTHDCYRRWTLYGERPGEAFVNG